MIYVCVFMCGGYICKFLHYAHSELQKKKIINFILPETIASTSSNIQKADKKTLLSRLVQKNVQYYKAKNKQDEEEECCIR